MDYNIEMLVLELSLPHDHDAKVNIISAVHRAIPMLNRTLDKSVT